MQIRDKTELKMKVREVVRNQPACDLYTRLSPDPMSDPQQFGLRSMLLRQGGLVTQAARLGLMEGSDPDMTRIAEALMQDNAPISDEAGDVLRAMDILGLSISGGGRYGNEGDAQGYAQAVLEISKLRGLLCSLDPLRVPRESQRRLEAAHTYLDVTVMQQQNRKDGYPDLGISQADVQVGTQYLKLAAWLFQLAIDEGASMMLVNLTDQQAFEKEAFLRHVVLPTCQKAGLALMVRLDDADCMRDLAHIAELQEFAPNLRVVCIARGLVSGTALIKAAQYQSRLLAVLPALPALIEEGLKRLGSHFSMHSGGTNVLELLIGRWMRIRPMVAQALFVRYAPLLSTDFTLTDEMIESDVARILGGAWDEFLRPSELLAKSDRQPTGY